MATTEPVHDWQSDYDIFDPGYVRDPYRGGTSSRGCPIAHTERWGGSWLPTRYEDIHAIAHDVEHFSSRRSPSSPAWSSPGTEHVHAAAHRLRPAGAHVVPAPPAAVVLATRRSRSTSRGPARCAARSSTASSTRVAPTPPPTTRSRSRRASSPSSWASRARWPTTSPVWVRDVLELGQTDIPLRRAPRGADRLPHREDRGPPAPTRATTSSASCCRREVDGEPVPDAHVLGTCRS